MRKSKRENKPRQSYTPARVSAVMMPNRSSYLISSLPESCKGDALQLLKTYMSDSGLSKKIDLIVHVSRLLSSSKLNQSANKDILKALWSEKELNCTERSQAFLVCCFEGLLTAIKIMIANCPDDMNLDLVNFALKSSGKTALMAAAEGCNLDCVKFFRKHDAMFSNDRSGRNELHYCVASQADVSIDRQKAVFDYLVKAGCDFTKKDNENRSPLGLAIWLGKDDVVSSHMGDYMEELQATLNPTSMEDVIVTRPSAFGPMAAASVTALIWKKNLAQGTEGNREIPEQRGDLFDESAGYPPVQRTSLVSRQQNMAMLAKAFKAVLHNKVNELSEIIDKDFTLVKERIKEKETLLMVAAKRGNVAAVRLLLEKKANPSSYYTDQVRLRNLEFETEITALTLIAQSRKRLSKDALEVVDTLLEFNISLDIGKVFTFGITNGHTQLVEKVLASEQWLEALRDYVHQNTFVKKPLRLLLSRMPDLLPNVFDKLIIFGSVADGFPVSEVQLENALLDESFVTTNVVTDFTFMDDVLKARGAKTTEVETRNEILMHPTSRLYIWSKWRKENLPLVYMFNFSFYVCFLISFTLFYFATLPLAEIMKSIKTKDVTYSTIKCHEIQALLSGKEDWVLNVFFHDIFRHVFWFFVLCEFVKEALELIFRYLLCSCEKLSVERTKLVIFSTHAVENVIFEWPFAVLSFLYTYNFCDFPTSVRLRWQRQCAALAFVLGWVDLLLLARKIPRFEKLAVYLRIFTIMADTLKSFFFMFFFALVGFSLSFHVLFGNLDQFSDYTRAVVKTLMIMIGEATFDEIFVNTANESKQFNEILAYAIFVFYAVSMMIMMLSLFIGLITIDMEKITNQAEFELTKMKGYLAAESISLIDTFKRYTRRLRHSKALKIFRCFGDTPKLKAQKSPDQSFVEIVSSDSRFEEIEHGESERDSRENYKLSDMPSSLADAIHELQSKHNDE